MVVKHLLLETKGILVLCWLCWLGSGSELAQMRQLLSSCLEYYPLLWQLRCAVEDALSPLAPSMKRERKASLCNHLLPRHAARTTAF